MAVVALSETPQDLTQQPPVPLKQTLVLVNAYVLETVQFLNHFSAVVETKLNAMALDLHRLDIAVTLLESKLNRVPEIAAATATNQPPPPTSAPDNAQQPAAADGSAAAGGDGYEAPPATAEYVAPPVEPSADAPPPPPPPPAAAASTPADDPQILALSEEARDAYQGLVRKGKFGIPLATLIPMVEGLGVSEAVYTAHVEWLKNGGGQ